MLDKYDNVVLDVPHAVEVLLRGHKLDNSFVSDQEEVDLYNRNCSLYMELDEHVETPVTEDLDYQEYHNKQINSWFVPEQYQSIDVEQYVLEKCKTQKEIKRAKYELQLYNERNLFPVLRLIIFLVDVMREKNIVWGVGRGSSVSSYVLFLLGLHKVDSIKYDLPIEEFLR